MGVSKEGDRDRIGDERLDGVAGAEIKLAGADETRQAAGISGSDRWYFRGDIGTIDDGRLGTNRFDGRLLGECPRGWQSDGKRKRQSLADDADRWFAHSAAH